MSAAATVQRPIHAVGDLFGLEREVALVTGAASGIGKAIAIGLGACGAKVGCFDRESNLHELAETIATIQAGGQDAIALSGSVTRRDDLDAAVLATERTLGPLSIAVNSAGVADASPAETMELDQWQRVVDVNLTGVFLSCQAEAQVMLPRKRGSIINIASISGMIFNPGLRQAHYNSSKAGVIHLTRSLAVEWSDRGIRVNAISPGYTLTPMNLRPEVSEQRHVFEAGTPMGRMAEPEEMVGPAVFLAGKSASFCTGVNLTVDGGVVCW